MSTKVPNDELLAAGLHLMEQAGRPLERIPSPGRSMIYQTSDGETVRVRTCNDHILIVVASEDSEDASLNIEGTDLLLFVYPATPRTPGPVVAYLLPVAEVAEAARRTHREWLATNPNTRGENTTWNLWFADDGPAKANGFARRWSRYKLGGRASTFGEPRSQNQPHDPGTSTESERGPSVSDLVSVFRQQVADHVGVSPNAVRIKIQLA